MFINFDLVKATFVLFALFVNEVNFKGTYITMSASLPCDESTVHILT